MGSHDFIAFPPRLDSVRQSSRVWLLLGEVQAKIEHIKEIPIPPEDSGILRSVYLTKGVHGTTAIEGNTFSEEEVGKIINNEMKAPPSRGYQEQEIRNMVRAINGVGRQEIGGSDTAFSIEVLNSYHELVLENLDEILDEDVVVGDLRTDRRVVGHQYLAAPPEDCGKLLASLCNWLNQIEDVPAGYEVSEQIIKALVAHVYFAWIHPYGDGNGRMARLLEFSILLRAGVPDVAAHLLSNFYNETRDMYSKQLQDSHGDFQDGAYRHDGKLSNFIEYALQGLKDSLDKQFLLIYGKQVEAIWHDFIHAEFRKKHSEKLTDVQQRQKRLVLDLTDHRLDTPVTVEEIRDVTPALAVGYLNRKDRTIERDLKELVNMKLLKRATDGYEPNTDILFRFFANARAKSE